jgi:hypothetical protein
MPNKFNLSFNIDSLRRKAAACEGIVQSVLSGLSGIRPAVPDIWFMFIGVVLDNKPL